jgi:hypothetical protein
VKITRSLTWGLLILLVVMIFIANIKKPAAASTPATAVPVPMLAYYYIWYDPSSWDRAKIDYPLLGHYSSDDRDVMLQQIQEAKKAGLDGFIVSWKSTDVLNRRLAQLADLAEQEDFKLVVIYQGLDFYRKPLPVERISSDLDYFNKQFASRPAFHLFSKPMVIWSGTWQFSTADIEQVSNKFRPSILLLASERNLDGYTRLSNLVDGNAYYWSSVNPDTYPAYPQKLARMSDAVHQNGGFWIPPAAPGFDARLVGGTSIVDRKDGDTFRTQINTAMSSSPDAIGIISWNEYSENSHIEPSEKFGNQYLDIVGEYKYIPQPRAQDFDSSEPLSTFPEIFSNSRAIALGGILILFVSAFIVIITRNRM